MFFQPLVECPACLSNVCSAACPTGNLINYSCFLLWRGAVFQLHQGLSECPVRVEADSDIQGGASILRMDLSNWQTYQSVMVALGMSGDGGGAEAGEGLQCWRITVLG